MCQNIVGDIFMFFYYFNDEVLFSINNISSNELAPILANTIGSMEKHVPNVCTNSNEVEVVINHVMEDTHYIMCICIETNLGFYLRELKPTDKPEFKIRLSDGEKAIRAYEYCNIHKLWHN